MKNRIRGFAVQIEKLQETERLVIKRRNYNRKNKIQGREFSINAAICEGLDLWIANEKAKHAKPKRVEAGE